jgi:3',5'-nucleoside bisphosphate phosphatase
MKKFALLITCLWPSLILHGQDNNRRIEFPDVPGYLTLKCDLHIHTVFSDGSVWPNIRIDEAVKDGLDAISLTEHLEYQPHKADLPHPDRNRSYQIAKELAKPHDLLVIHGVEITRKLPPGHANAIFITDANKLNIRDSVEAYREANRQGAFVFWNHPNWISQQRDGVATLTDLHRMLIREKLLHGIEVVNDITFSDEALRIAMDNGLTVMGTSDIHGLVDWQFQLDQGGHRPVTLVFATEKSEEALREALFSRRTVAWFNNLLIGDRQFIGPLVNASVKVTKATYQGPSSVAIVEFENTSDATFILQNRSDYRFHGDSDVILLKPHATTRIEVKTREQKADFDLQFEVLNAITAPNEHPVVTWRVKVDL